MAKSGAKQELALATPATTPSYTAISGIGSAYSGMTLTPELGVDESTSGGLTTSQKTGYRVNSASFSIAETPASVGELLGRNGKRFAVRHRPQGSGSGLAQVTFEAIATVSRTMSARGRRDFGVELAIDGAITRSVQ